MTLEQILVAVDGLSSAERELLKEYLAQHESQHPRQSVEDWLAEFQSIAREFRGNSSDEEMQQIVEAITLKS